MEPTSCRLAENEESATAELDFTAKYLNLDPDSCTAIFKDQTIASLPLTNNIAQATIAEEEKDVNEETSELIPVVSIQSDELSVEIVACDSSSSNAVSVESKTYEDGFSLDLSLDSIQDHIDIDAAVMPGVAETMDITDNQVPVYPELIFVSDSTASDNTIDLNNIQLYLECSDDNENLVTASPLESSYEIMSQTGPSTLKSDVRLKISFPVLTEERDKGFKCCVCKNYFTLDEELRSHILQEHHLEICMCPFCSYNTKSKKFFETHIKTKHKQILQNSEMPSDHVLVAYSSEQTAHSSTDHVNEPSQLCCQAHSNVDTSAEVQVCNTDISSYQVEQEIQQSESVTSALENVETHSVETACLIEDDVDIGLADCTELQDSDALAVSSINVAASNVIVAASSINVDAECRGGNSENFVCQVCAFVTTSAKLLNMHHSTMHDLNRTVYKCNKCSYICKQRRSFLSHMGLHMGTYSFECELCLKKFVTKSMYTRHMKNHSEGRKHSCDVKGCVKTFKTKGALTDHKKKVHDVFPRQSVTQDSTEIAAHMIDKSTSTSQDRLKAKNTKVPSHTSSRKCSAVSTSSKADTFTASYQEGSSQIKSFKCSSPSCNKAFRDNFNLKNHMCVHNGVKTIACSHCDFVCVQKSSLNYHYKSKHKDT